MSIFYCWYDLDLENKKNVSLNGQPLQTSLDLNPIGHGGYLTIFCHQAIRMSTFKALYSLDYKSKGVSLNNETLKNGNPAK